MIGTIIDMLTGGLVPILILAAGAVAAFFGYGWKKKREGRQAEKAKADARHAKNVRIARDETNAASTRTEAETRKRLRDRTR